MKVKTGTQSRLCALTYLVFMTLYLTGCSDNKPAEKTAATKTSEFLHPMNPLGLEEISLVKKILVDAEKMDTTFRFYVINLQEPPKAEMLKYSPGDPFRREAFAVVFDRSSNKTYEAVVDLTAKTVLSFTHIPRVTPGSFEADSVADEL